MHLRISDVNDKSEKNTVINLPQRGVIDQLLHYTSGIKDIDEIYEQLKGHTAKYFRIQNLAYGHLVFKTHQLSADEIHSIPVMKIFSETFTSSRQFLNIQRYCVFRTLTKAHYHQIFPIND